MLQRFAQGRFRRLVCILFALVTAAVAAPRTLAAQDPTPDIIRGRVIKEDSSAIPGATVKVTSFTTGNSRTARTDAKGQFSILVQNGGGDYTVNVTAIGLTPVETRIRREGDEEVLRLTVVMKPSVQTLAAARIVESRRPRPEVIAPDIGAANNSANSSALPPNLQGDILAMVSLIPGFTMLTGPDGAPLGFSALGLAANQNNVTMNGMTVSANSIPSNANVNTKVSTTTADASRGGFSGANVSMTPFGGSPYTSHSLRIVVDDPTLQWSDPQASSLNSEFRNVAISGNSSGEIVPERALYNLAWQLGRRTSPLNTLLSADSAGLVRQGLSPDSVVRFEQVLHTLGVPFSAAGVPGSRESDNGSILARVDLNTTAGGAAYNATINANFNRALAASFGPRVLPSYGGSNSSWRANPQLYGSMNVGSTFLNETRIGVDLSGNSGDPYVALPQGSVLVSSADPNGGINIQNLQFGSGSSLSRSGKTGVAQVTDNLSWFSDDSKHRLKLSADPRYEWYDQVEQANTRGTFIYNSLSDLASGLPSSFVRRLSAQERTGGLAGGSVSLMDTWRKTNNLQFQYGLRYDRFQFLTRPDYNPDVDRQFGLRTDRPPDAGGVSPRFGVSWNFGKAPAMANTMFGPQILGTLAGTVGRYWQTLGASTLSGAIDNTGLPSGAQQVTCIGSAVPTPNWAGYLANPRSIPTACADGSGGAPFTVTQPAVFTFDPRYQPPSSWRGNLRYSGFFTAKFRLSAEVTYSLNDHLSASLDRNFVATPRFTLANEGGRPVYADPSSIVPGSGSVSLLASRFSTNFAQVMANEGDGQSRSQQLTLTLSPFNGNICFANCPISWNVAWTLQRIVDRVRGFGGNTAANPLDFQWGRSSGDITHQINLNLYKSIGTTLNMQLSAVVRSGQPFTPIVSGDVNGDGSFNDRAFVFSPAATSDTAVASGMRSILANAPAAVRACLQRQVGRVADRNSCEGPWTVSNLTARFYYRPFIQGTASRMNFTLTFSNPLTGLDALVHRGRLEGWGQPAFPDPTLLYVRGFDAGSSAFKYQVNQRFGETRAALSIPTAPFQATLEMRVSLGPSNEVNSGKMTMRQVMPAGKPAMEERAIKARYAGQSANQLLGLIQQKDSLALTRAQVDSITRIVGQLNKRTDSVWTPLAAWLAKEPRTGHEREIGRRLSEANRITTVPLCDALDAVRLLLTPAQLKKVKQPLSFQLDAGYIKFIRQQSNGPIMIFFGGG